MHLIQTLLKSDVIELQLILQWAILVNYLKTVALIVEGLWVGKVPSILCTWLRAKTYFNAYQKKKNCKGTWLSSLVKINGFYGADFFSKISRRDLLIDVMSSTKL